MSVRVSEILNEVPDETIHANHQDRSGAQLTGTNSMGLKGRRKGTCFSALEGLDNLLIHDIHDDRKGNLRVDWFKVVRPAEFRSGLARMIQEYAILGRSTVTTHIFVTHQPDGRP
jgi:hypothetical protein